MDRETMIEAVLSRARQLIQRGWCQVHLADDVNGNAVTPGSPDAVAWCAQGALVRAIDELVPQEHSPAATARDVVYCLCRRFWPQPPQSDRFSHVLACIDLARYNDRPWRTQEQVLRLFDEALQRK